MLVCLDQRNRPITACCQIHVITEGNTAKTAGELSEIMEIPRSQVYGEY